MGRDRYEDLDIDGTIAFRRQLKEIGCDGVDWMNQAQDRYQWRAVLSILKNWRIP
jgi:hypothetical protein